MPDPARPLAALGSDSNKVTYQSGSLSYSSSFSIPAGVFLVRFTSDASETRAGWSFSWAAAPVSKFCTNRTFTGADGTVEDGSGTGDYGNR